MKNLDITLASLAAVVFASGCTAEDQKSFTGLLNGQDTGAVEQADNATINDEQTMPASTKTFRIVFALEQAQTNLEDLCNAAGSVSCEAEMAYGNKRGVLTLTYASSDRVTIDDVAGIISAQENVKYAEADYIAPSDAEAVIKEQSSSTYTVIEPSVAKYFETGEAIAIDCTAAEEAENPNCHDADNHFNLIVKPTADFSFGAQINLQTNVCSVAAAGRNAVCGISDADPESNLFMFKISSYLTADTAMADVKALPIVADVYRDPAERGLGEPLKPELK